jgi:hypothetical protein
VTAPAGEHPVRLPNGETIIRLKWEAASGEAVVRGGMETPIELVIPIVSRDRRDQ